MSLDIPRRNLLEQLIPAETACNIAVWEIETLGADERLTRAQNLISQATNLVSDWYDEQLKKDSTK